MRWSHHEADDVFHTDSFIVLLLWSLKKPNWLFAGEMEINVAQDFSKTGSAAQMEMHKDDNSSEDLTQMEVPM